MKPRALQYLLTWPVMILLIVSILLPSLYVGWLSFHRLTYGTEAEFVGFGNYIALLTDPAFWRATWNTFILVNIIVYAELAIGLGVALFLARGVPLPRLVLTIILVPYAISEVVSVVAFRYIFDYQIGIVNLALRTFGIAPLEWGINTTHTFIVVGLLAIWQHIPFTFIILYAARLGLPQDYYEAARIDGASSFAQFRDLTFPLLLPALLIAMLFRYIFAFRIFSEVWLLTEGGPARQSEVLSVYLFRQGFRYQEFGMASAVGWLMLILSLAISAFYLRVMYKRMFN